MFRDTRNAGRKPGQLNRRDIIPDEDRYLTQTSQKYQNMNATHLQQELDVASRTTVSTETVRIRLHSVDILCPRQPMVCVTLTARYPRTHK